MLSVKHYDEQQNFEEFFLRAQLNKEPLFCDLVDGMDETIRCYSYFIDQGFRACDTVGKKEHCFVALGIITDDEEVCHLDILRKNLIFKNECMAQIHEKRYQS